jgi:hypothetical protein
MAQNATPEAFANAVLRKLGIKPTAANRKALVGWEKAEGGHWHNDAKFNPLNTTQDMPGSGDTGTQGNISVYRNWNQGVKATAKTLTNGRYGNVLQALKGGSPQDVAKAIDASPWGTHGSLLYQTIEAAQPGSGGDSLPGGGSAQPQAGHVVTQGPTFTEPKVNTDIAGAITDALLMGKQRKGASLLQTAMDLLSTGQYTTKTPAQVTPGKVTAKPSPEQVTGQKVGLVAEATKRANLIDQQKLPYLWGGGHAKKVTNYKKTEPLDCSGAVSAVLGIDPRVSGQFSSWGKKGRAPNGKGITVYSNAEHVLMEIDGHFFGTSQSNPGGGAGWIPRSQISDSYLSRFTARHVTG